MRWTDKTQAISQTLIDELQLPTNFQQIVESIYLPLTHHILDKKSDNPLFININGAQGTGKSTLTYFLKHLIEAETEFSVAAISLDDFYSTRSERQKLAQSLHPLLLTRGVPGTHDVQLMESTLSMILNGQACSIPRFNKALDDRYTEDQWTFCKKNTDIILFEGWCNHSPVQSEKELSTPINKLESEEDPEGVWRHYANEQLKDYHLRIFSHADMSIMLKAPDFEKIYEWRSLQEDKLKQNSQSSHQSYIMPPDKLKRFIQHYERITRHTLLHLPETADIVIPVAADHSIKQIFQRHAT
jgi:D-glycerate 3-kinase